MENQLSLQQQQRLINEASKWVNLYPFEMVINTGMELLFSFDEFYSDFRKVVTEIVAPKINPNDAFIFAATKHNFIGCDFERGLFTMYGKPIPYYCSSGNLLIFGQRLHLINFKEIENL